MDKVGKARADAGAATHDAGHAEQRPGKRTLTESLDAGAAKTADAGTTRTAGAGTAAFAAGKSADAGTAEAAPRRVVGDPAWKKLIRVAWTFDDGPSEGATDKMRAEIGSMPATWFVVRNEIEAGGDAKKQLAKLKRVQDAGSEIAIHSMHPKDSHVSWFPSNLHDSYPSTDAAIADLEAFHKQLTGAGITIKFVRLPYGEHTEVTELLEKLGMDERETAEDVARKIIMNRPVSFDPPRAKGADGGAPARPGLTLDAGAKPADAGTPKLDGGTKPADAGTPKTAAELAAAKAEERRARYTGITATAKEEWDKLVAALGRLKLHDWGGSGGTKPEISGVSWEAESSGTLKRKDADNVTSSHLGVVKDAKTDQRGKFETLVDQVTDKTPRSLIVLAHDTFPDRKEHKEPENVAEVGRDIQRMEQYAAAKQVRIEYCTMSELYTALRGSAP